MKIKVIVHEDEPGRIWAEVPAIPGCGAEGKSMEELLKNLKLAIEDWLDVNADDMELPPGSRLLQIDV